MRNDSNAAATTQSFEASVAFSLGLAENRRCQAWPMGRNRTKPAPTRGLALNPLAALTLGVRYRQNNEIYRLFAVSGG